MLEDDKLTLRPYGILLLGANIAHLDWVLRTTTSVVQIVNALTPFRSYAQVVYLEDVGAEAITYHDFLTSLTDDTLTTSDLAALWDVKTKWSTLATTRMEDLYLITPVTLLNPKNLMAGIAGVVSTPVLGFLEPIEVADLNESVQCLLIGSATGAEVMALRAAENLLRRWYTHASRDQAGRKSWPKLLKWFNDFYPRKRDAEAELALLQYLKIRRNEVAHPHAMSSPSTAQVTLMNVCGTAAGIARLMQPQDLEPEEQSETDSNEQ